MSETTDRARTRIDAIADEHVARVVALSPTTATYLGLPGDHGALDDYSPDGITAAADLARETLAAVQSEQPRDDVDAVTKDAMTAALALDVELDERGYLLGTLNVIESPLQDIRMTFDMMATDSEDDWATIATRLRAVPAALDSYVASLRAGKAVGRVAAIRQVEKCIEQARHIESPDGYFQVLVSGAEVPDSLRSGLESAVRSASEAYGQLADLLGQELAPFAPARDAVGREEYELWSAKHVGVRVDLEETYAWGLDELERIIAEQREVAERIRPGASIRDAMAALDNDPDRMLHGTDALQAWMQQLADTAVADLADTHFDIPDPVKRIECKIATTPDGGIYYTGPSDDFSRPGRMWWAVPDGVEDFSTWRETTTVYHEGVPGHHLQIAQTTYRRELLNDWRRLLAGNSGHWEGWALYAERLMDELGYLGDAGDKMGMLDGQRLRAARVVLDIGVHLELQAPEHWGGGAWTAGTAWPFLLANAQLDEEMLAFEFDRYLGWPGQAPSYKIGERLWKQLRADAERQAAERGAAFDLKDFHRRALDVGSVGMDTLSRAVLA